MRGHPEGRVPHEVALGETEYLDAVGAQEGDGGACVGFTERRAQPGLHEGQNFCHEASIELVSGG